MYKFSSTGRTTSELNDFICSKGHRGYVAHGERKCIDTDTFYIGNFVDHKLHAFLSRLTGLVGYFSTVYTKRLLRVIQKISPDVVHIRNLHSNFINIPMILSYLGAKNIATVITLHDCFFYTGKCTHYTVDNCFKWQFECGSCPRLKKDNVSWFADRTKKMLMDKKICFSNFNRLAVIGVSDWITDEAKKSILKNALIVKRIYNWVDLEVFKPNYLLQNSNFMILGVATNWSADKGLDKFIELANLIPSDVNILLVGKMENRLNLPQNLKHINETRNVSELVYYYNIASVFINFSLEESFGKVSAEALACGTPVITNKYTANPELIGHKCGYIVADVRGAHEAVLLVKKNKKSFYSPYCRSHAEKNFDKENNIREYLGVYNDLLMFKGSKC